MRKELRINPVIYPQPVLMLATYNEDGSVDVMNAAWGCAIDTDIVGICLSEHRTNENFRRTGAFTVSMATVDTIAAADYFGLVSGAKENKMARVGFHSHPSDKVKAPIIEEFPVCLECLLDHEDPATGMTYGKIVRVSAEEDVLDANGNLNLVKAGAVMLDLSSHQYYSVGKVVAEAFSAGKKYKK